MKVAVWDTYVTKKDGAVMHFDILAPEDIKDENTIHSESDGHPLIQVMPPKHSTDDAPRYQSCPCHSEVTPIRTQYLLYSQLSIKHFPKPSEHRDYYPALIL